MNSSLKKSLPTDGFKSYCNFSGDHEHVRSNDSLEVTTTNKNLSQITVMNITNMSHSAVSINFMHMSNITAAAVVTVHKQHRDVHSPWSHRPLAVHKLCARACIMSRRVAGKGRFL
jgi:hypothetical protein